jgi:tetratricopeptide (TPR) repeat protein
MRGKISPAVKPYILEILSNIINSEGVPLLGIKCDDLGSRLHLKFNNLCTIKTSDYISGELLLNLASSISGTLTEPYHHLKDSSPNEAVEILKDYVSKTINCQYEGLDKTASNLIVQLYCTTLGSVLASLNIYHYNTVSADALKLFSLGLNTDVASSKLKLASILYCVQEIQKADSVLSEIERRYDLQIVEPVCSCNLFGKKSPRQGFFELCDDHNEEVLQYTTAFCVIFLPWEIYCVPTELRYEMFRSTQEDRMFRTKLDNRWMDCAVVDSLPYLYFLQYKVCSLLGRHDQKQAALFKLIRTIKEERNLGHRETALNILGKCMEHEGRAGDALQCYLMSLNIRGRNNAAKIHITTLLSLLINTRT